MASYEKDYIKENILLDSNSFHVTAQGKVEGTCMLDDMEVTISLPKSINRVDIMKAIENNNITNSISERIIANVQKELNNETNTADTKRVRACVDEETYQKMLYWSKKRDCSVNEYLTLAIEHMIAWENQDYDLPTLEQQRLNQLINVIQALASDVRCLEHITSEGFKSLIGLTRGDNYLLDEGGEL